MTRSDQSAYRSLTLTPEQVAEHNALHDAFDDARQRAALPVAERDALDAQLESMERAAQDREAERSAKAAERQRLATDGDLNAVERVQARLLALDAVEAAQAEMAQSVRRRRAELEESIIPAAQDEVEEALDAVERWSADHAGMIPRGLVDFFILQRVRHFAAAGLADDEDGETFIDALRYLPDTIAEQVVADPERFIRQRYPHGNTKAVRQGMTADEARRILPEVQQALAREAQLHGAQEFGVQAGAFTRGAGEPVYNPLNPLRIG